MMRSKLGLLVHDIASRIGISLPQFYRMFTSWIRFMRLALEAIQRFPSRMEVRNFMPSECKKYTNLRVIIDCIEFLIETPSSLTAQRETWSAYKSHNTYKVLVGCTPDGVLSYISRLYGGAASDKFITVDSGFTEHLQAGDTLMADKGFNIHNEVRAKGAVLNIRPFRTPGQLQFTEDEVEETRSIAKARIRIECLIERIKFCHILDGVLPLTLYPVAEDIIHTCAYLTNFQSPLLPQDSVPMNISDNPISRSSEEAFLERHPLSSF